MGVWIPHSDKEKKMVGKGLLSSYRSKCGVTKVTVIAIDDSQMAV